MKVRTRILQFTRDIRNDHQRAQDQDRKDAAVLRKWSKAVERNVQARAASRHASTI